MVKPSHDKKKLSHQGPITNEMAQKGYPFLTITHNLTEGTVTTSIAPDITDEQMDKIGYILRVALFNFADVLSMKQAEQELFEENEEETVPDKPPEPPKGVNTAYR